MPTPTPASLAYKRWRAKKRCPNQRTNDLRDVLVFYAVHDDTPKELKWFINTALQHELARKKAKKTNAVRHDALNISMYSEHLHVLGVNEQRCRYFDSSSRRCLPRPLLHCANSRARGCRCACCCCVQCAGGSLVWKHYWYLGGYPNATKTYINGMHGVQYHKIGAMWTKLLEHYETSSDGVSE